MTRGGVVMQSTDIWSYRAESGFGTETSDVAGYKVEATDGSIGKVDEATYETGSSYIVVDTGPWIFGKKVLLPAGVVDRIDRDDEKVYVNRTKDQIKDAPELGGTSYTDEEYRTRIGSYYGPGGPGYIAW
jgi:hypothetical protein